MLNFKGNKKPVCANCHFLKLYGGIEGSIQKNPDDKARNSIRNGDFDVVTKFTDEMELVFECYHKVWSEGYNSGKGFDRSKEARQKEINETLRKGKNLCFFFEYRPGMLYPAAIELQKRLYELKQASIDRRYTTISLLIAAGALIVAIIAI